MALPFYNYKNSKMKKFIASLAVVSTIATTSVAQTTAVNWTATDCNGSSHTLFNELDNGKIIVFAWVMPCGSCVAPSKTAYDVVQTYATSHPGKVLFYMADDLGDASCSTLSGWVTSNSIGNTANMTIFNNSGNVINEADFGGSGMPHIIVMGGADHKIYFNKKNGASNDAAGIQNAINTALGTTGVANLNNEVSFSVAPNPVHESLRISCSKAVKSVVITNTSGQVIREISYPGNKLNPVVDLSQFADGVYGIILTDAEGGKGTQKIVKQ